MKVLVKCGHLRSTHVRNGPGDRRACERWNAEEKAEEWNKTRAAEMGQCCRWD